jgi:hypothetical protein
MKRLEILQGPAIVMFGVRAGLHVPPLLASVGGVLSPSQRSGIVSHLVVLPVVLPIAFLWGDAVSPANIAGVGISGKTGSSTTRGTVLQCWETTHCMGRAT